MGNIWESTESLFFLSVRTHEHALEMKKTRRAIEKLRKEMKKRLNKEKRVVKRLKKAQRVLKKRISKLGGEVLRGGESFFGNVDLFFCLF